LHSVFGLLASARLLAIEFFMGTASRALTFFARDPSDGGTRVEDDLEALTGSAQGNLSEILSIAKIVQFFRVSPVCHGGRMVVFALHIFLEVIVVIDRFVDFR
jgi:hypothetical protein